MYREVLQQIGLPKNEAQIYEALVGLGKANISEIARFSKVNRRNVYDSIGSLLEKRLVMRVAGPKEHLYRAAEPKRLLDILNEQRRSLGTVLPELKNLFKSSQPQEQAFISRGPEGIKNFWKYATAQSDTIYWVGGKGAWHDQKIEQERKLYFEACRKKGIKIQGIFDYQVLVSGRDIYSQYDPKLIRFFPPEYSTKASFDICADYIMLFSNPQARNVENVICFNIVSQKLADSFRLWFKYLWQNARKLPDKNDK